VPVEPAPVPAPQGLPSSASARASFAAPAW